MTPPRGHQLAAVARYELERLSDKNRELHDTLVERDKIEAERDAAYAELRGAYTALGLRHDAVVEERDALEKRVHELGNKAHIATFQVDLLRDALIAAIDGMKYAERHYLSTSAAAEMWAHCNGYEGAVDAREILAMTGDGDEPAS